MPVACSRLSVAVFLLRVDCFLGAVDFFAVDLGAVDFLAVDLLGAVDFLAPAFFPLKRLVVLVKPLLAPAACLLQYFCSLAEALPLFFTAAACFVAERALPDAALY
jgi:hypothetical protein